MSRDPATSRKLQHRVRVCIGLGANLGDRAATLRHAAEQVIRRCGLRGARLSRLHETAPMGPQDQPAYLNAALAGWAAADAQPEEALATLQRLETEAGRPPEADRVHWGPRVLDLDLLLWGDLVVDSARLTLPHPRLHERRFVLAPLAEVSPDAVHPGLSRRIDELLLHLPAGA